jgi:act minimal PKS chain-length factor (CLF/KS beta)
VTGARPVITGLGAVAPNGRTAPEYWSATLRGRSGLGPLTRFDAPGHPVQVAGQIDDFEPAAHVGSRLLPQTDRTTQLALAASDEAVRDAGLAGGQLDRDRCGVVTASSSGGFEFGQRELQHLWSEGPARVSAYMSFAWFYAVDSGQLSIRHDLRGPTGVLVNEQAGGLDALGQARRLVRKGTPVVLTGGTHASLCPFGWAAHAASGACSEVDDPARAYLPFDPDAAGYVPGEGGAILVLEDAGHARARGATPYATVAGYAATFDPGTGPDAGLRAARAAIADAGLTPADIAGVLADGSADPAADRAEAGGLRELFGPHGVPVTAPKVLTGRLFSGSALDVAAAVLALRDRVLPPTPGVAAAPEYELDLVTDEPRPLDGDAVLVQTRGRGGFHAAAVLTR